MEYEEKELYLYLDFKRPLPPSFFKTNKKFFRIISLDTDAPIVQLDDVLYKGTYSDAIGTNVFFEETENDCKETIERPTPIKLKHLLNQTKVLELERVKLPEDIFSFDKTDYVKLNLDTDYKEILDKIGNGTFQIDDYVLENAPSESEEQKEAKNEPTEVNSNEEQVSENKENPPDVHKEITEDNSENSLMVVDNETDPIPLVSLQLETQKEEEENKHSENVNILKRLAQQPLQIDHESDIIPVRQGFQFQNNLIPYATIDLMLQNMSVEELIFDSDLGSSVNSALNSKAIIKQGTLQCIQQVSEIHDLLNIGNFENLGLIGKLVVLIKYLKAEERHLKELNPDELKNVDSFGRTPLQKHELLKFFVLRIFHLISKKIKNYPQFKF